MWEQWLLKSRQGSQQQRDDDSIRGPAPPAAVAAAAKIAFSCLGTVPSLKLFRTEQHEKPVSERPPVEPASSAILERTNSGTIRVPLFTVSSEIGLSDFVDSECKVAAIDNNTPTPQITTVRDPLENQQRRNRNLQWLRLNFRALTDISRLPFNNADLFQLHQYYFSPPLNPTSDHIDRHEGGAADKNRSALDTATLTAHSLANQHRSNATDSFVNRTVSFHTLPSAAHVVGVLDDRSPSGLSHKRRTPASGREEGRENAPKRAKNFEPRIAYYPRLMVSFTLFLKINDATGSICCTMLLTN